MAKGNVLDDRKSGAFGAMTTFDRSCFGKRLRPRRAKPAADDEARMTRSRGCARVAKGNVLDDRKSGAFGAMTTFDRSCFGERLRPRRAKPAADDEARMTRSRGCARVAKGNGL
jgi:hypothetical protein